MNESLSAPAYWDTVPPEYLEEARGVADGAGVRPLEVVLVTAIWEMYLVGGCSEMEIISFRPPWIASFQCTLHRQHGCIFAPPAVHL